MGEMGDMGEMGRMDEIGDVDEIGKRVKRVEWARRLVAPKPIPLFVPPRKLLEPGTDLYSKMPSAVALGRQCRRFGSQLANPCTQRVALYGTR